MSLTIRQGKASHKQVKERLEATTTPPCPIMEAFNREQFWRSRSEWEIRAEMDMRIRRRLGKLL